MVLPVLALTGVAVVILLATTHPNTSAERIDVVKTALSVGAGTGGVVALVLTGRRQWHVEQAQRATEKSQQAAEHDADERRITELYGKAVEQLGSDKAPVRLGGLYALERLAQNNPVHRQTIVDVICAYLRMPYEQPTESAESGDPSTARAERFHRVEEQQVRLTAQDILTRHMHPDRSTFWRDTDLNLTGAILVNGIDLRRCRVRTARFDGAVFTGHTSFDETWFTGNATFEAAQFCGGASFVRAQFNSEAIFNRAWFTGDASFGVAGFATTALFEHARFLGDALFDRTRFDGAASFTETSFSDASFERAQFAKAALFDGVQFRGLTNLGGAQFTSGFDPGTDRIFGSGPCWVRGDKPEHDGHSIQDWWPSGWTVKPTEDRPRGVAEGTWGMLVESESSRPIERSASA